VLVLGRPFKPGLMFVGEGKRRAHERCSTFEGFYPQTVNIRLARKASKGQTL